MTSEDPYEDDFLNVPHASDAGHGAQDAGRPEPDQPPAGPEKELTLRRFDEDAFLDIPKLKSDSAETIELHRQEEPVPKRPLPAVIDVFLYPFGKAGLATLSIMLGGPTVLILVALACIWMCQAAPLLLLLAAPIALAGMVVTLGMVLYFCWYICECIRDSAAGGIRAPDTMGMTPGIMDMFAQDFQLLVCVGVCVGLYTSTVNCLPMNSAMACVLMGTIAFLFPMTLLRVIMSESLQGLLPWVTLRLIGRCCGPYCVLVLALSGLPGLGYVLSRATEGWPLPARLALLIGYGLYACLVYTHLLGRFAWRYRDRLDWE
jgi:hypothetical protein